MATIKIAALNDPMEDEPPSSPSTLLHAIKVAKKQNIDLIPVESDYLKITEFDALFIRQTTGMGNTAHELALTAEHFKVPVIDDPVSIEVCCNKVECTRRFIKAGIPIPETVIFDVRDPLAAEAIHYPIVVKDPASCFSRGVFRVHSRQDLLKIAEHLTYKVKHLAVAQAYVPTEFDWRVGVLNGQPLFCCQYRMARGHWQIVKYYPDGHSREGGHTVLRPSEFPQDVCRLAVNAAATVGDGLYGVDIKATKQGLVVIEVNDNPSINHGIEDRYGQVWETLLDHFKQMVQTNCLVPTA